MTDKLIVTNENALERKYGASGLRKVKEAAARMVAADRTRGLVTRLIALDSARAMARMRGRPVLSVRDCRQNKEAIDAVWRATSPDYLMVLGADDVVPHQDLRNPVHAAGDDEDVAALGDLPYACDAPYSRDITRFVGPTRVVSRLPDLTGARDPDHLIARIDAAAGWSAWEPGDAERYFALSAAEWRGSTSLSVSNVFGSTAGLELAPPDGPRFPAPVIGAHAHFINCHGADADPAFYGQLGHNFPPALTSRTARGRVTSGTVAAVECCYGAQLYPAGPLHLPEPICQSYLTQGAYGYFGSTTIAYGPADGNAAADILAQSFLLEVLGGASLGRAALAARQAFVEQTAQMDPIDLKTLAQFCLYGDPSIHPVAVPSPTTRPTGVKARTIEGTGRRERRAKLAAIGRRLQDEQPTAGAVDRRRPVSRRVRSVLRGLSAEAGVAPAQFVPFAVKRKAGTRVAKALGGPERYHLLVARTDGRDAPVVPRVAILAKESGRRVVAYRVYYSR